MYKKQFEIRSCTNSTIGQFKNDLNQPRVEHEMGHLKSVNSRCQDCC